MLSLSGDEAGLTSPLSASMLTPSSLAFSVGRGLKKFLNPALIQTGRLDFSIVQERLLSFSGHDGECNG